MTSNVQVHPFSCWSFPPVLSEVRVDNRGSQTDTVFASRQARVNDIRLQWEAVRRPSRPAGPGRPRGHKRPNHDSSATPTGAAAASSLWGGETLTLSGPGDGEGTKKCKKKGTSRASAGPREDASALGKVSALVRNDLVCHHVSKSPHPCR